MSLISFFIIILCVMWFGGTFIYFVRYIDRKSDYKVTSLSIITSFLGDLNNISKFYRTFISSHPTNNQKGAFILLVSHIISPIVFWLVVLYEAFKSGELSLY